MTRVALDEAAAMPRLAAALADARRNPKVYWGRKVRAVRSDGRVVELAVGPRGGIRRRVVGVVGS